MANYSERLKDLRKNSGLSQQQLANEIGISKSSINMYERGEREPGFETTEAIADFFNVSVDYLLGRTDEYFTLERCNFCGFVFTDIFKEKEEHKQRHELVKQARKKHGFFYTWNEREEIKNNFYSSFKSIKDESKKKEIAIEYLKQYFSRSLEGSGFSSKHVVFKKYAGMLLYQEHFKNKFLNIYENIIKEFPPQYGIEEGNTYYNIQTQEEKDIDYKIDSDLTKLLETLKNRSEMRMLFKLSSKATKEEVEQAVKIIEALRKK